jgi:hypothetical protein
MSYIKALLAEREGYVQRGLKDRVAQVDALLKKIGNIEIGETATIENEVEVASRPRKTTKRKV